MKYNRQQMMAILWDRMPYLGEVVKTETIPLEKAPKAYQTFSEGSPKEVRHPHGSVKKVA
jgi:glutathione-independent formaldehyde dehydrogenase